MSLTVKLALGSIFVGLAVLTLKYLAYWVTGSIALYSDALESVINVATAIAAFFAIRISLTPADREHPYGHSKAEYLSAVLEGVLIHSCGVLDFAGGLSRIFASQVIGDAATRLSAQWHRQPDQCALVLHPDPIWTSTTLARLSS